MNSKISLSVQYVMNGLHYTNLKSDKHKESFKRSKEKKKKSSRAHSSPHARWVSTAGTFFLGNQLISFLLTFLPPLQESYLN